MTNTIAFFLAAVIIGLFALDYFILAWGLPILVMQRLITLIDAISFWR
ncbi:hypothetical protein [Yoonia sp.]|nr:hypothetical protein [Yoonia sp.]MBE0413320.1 hypothetical protein [Yoonia sp.]